MPIAQELYPNSRNSLSVRFVIANLVLNDWKNGPAMNTHAKSLTPGTKPPPIGETPAIALIDPKYPHNVGMVVRLASCYGLRQVWFTGDRVSLDAMPGERLPREERMKGYKDVQIVHNERVFERFADAVPVAVEVRAKSEPLHLFEHPENALYVFGPEDGSISKPMLRHCHRFVVIPARHRLNLATAVATVLWDREYKKWIGGKIDFPTTPGGFERRVACRPDENKEGCRKNGIPLSVQVTELDVSRSKHHLGPTTIADQADQAEQHHTGQSDDDRGRSGNDLGAAREPRNRCPIALVRRAGRHEYMCRSQIAITVWR